MTLSLHTVQDVVRQLWGSEASSPKTADAAKPTFRNLVPWLVTEPLTRGRLHEEVASNEPKEWFAQSRMEGCEYVVVLTRLEKEPVIVLMPVDERLQLSAQNFIEVIKVPSTMWHSAAAMFDGTLLCAVRADAKHLFLYDVAVSCGCTFVGCASLAPFTSRMAVLDAVANNMRSLLKNDGWGVFVAPWVPCGSNQDLSLFESFDARGIFFVHNHKAVNDPRLTWARHSHIQMSLCGDTWFVSGEHGAITSVLPNVRVEIDEDTHGAVGKMCPMSMGRFVPRVEHAHRRKGLPFCQKWLVLHKVEPALTFRNFDMPPWQCVLFCCDTKETVSQKFSSLRDQLEWDAEVYPFILRGVVVPTPKHTCRACVFDATNSSNITQVTRLASDQHATFKRQSVVGGRAGKGGKKKKRTRLEAVARALPSRSRSSGSSGSGSRDSDRSRSNSSSGEGSSEEGEGSRRKRRRLSSRRRRRMKRRERRERRRARKARAKGRARNKAKVITDATVVGADPRKRGLSEWTCEPDAALKKVEQKKGGGNRAMVVSGRTAPPLTERARRLAQRAAQCASQV